jgi:cysteine-rich repeat protein
VEKGETVFVVLAGSTYQGSSPAGPYTLEVKQNGICGDGDVDLGEQCDDGNVAPADGCDPNCSLEVSMVEMESNGSVAMANAVSGSLIYATIDPSNDEDLYAISVKADETVIVQLLPAFDNGCGEGTTMSLGDVDSELELLATDGVTSIAFQESSFCNYIATGVPSAGTYYVRVSASTTYCPGCRFGYRLLVKTEAQPPPPAGDPWINEIHYDNVGGDQNEFVEVAGPAGLDLSGWLLIAYNGSNGTKYDTQSLSGVFPDQQNGYGTLAFDFSALQNGAPDGVTLVDGNNNNSVIDFISYEGNFVATDGEAQGAMSSDIGVSETSSTPLGDALYMMGTGNQKGSFTWAPMTTAHSKGQVNTGQMFQ